MHNAQNPTNMLTYVYDILNFKKKKKKTLKFGNSAFNFIKYR